MRDAKKEGGGDMSENNYQRYQELGGIINEKDYQGALTRAENTTTLDKALILQVEGMSKFARITLHNSKDALDPRTILYGILRVDAKPIEVKYHHSQMGDHRLFAEALRILGDAGSLQKLVEAHPNIPFN